MGQTLRPGEFLGTYSQLASIQKRTSGVLEFNARVITPDTKLYIDQSGTIYAPSEGGKLTLMVGFARML